MLLVCTLLINPRVCNSWAGAQTGMGSALEDGYRAFMVVWKLFSRDQWCLVAVADEPGIMTNIPTTTYPLTQKDCLQKNALKELSLEITNFTRNSVKK